MTEFDIQNFLRDMRWEQQELAKRVEAGFAQTTAQWHAHELADTTRFGGISLRLQVLESLHRNLKWFSRTAIATMVTVVLDVAFNHLPKWVHWFQGGR